MRIFVACEDVILICVFYHSTLVFTLVVIRGFFISYLLNIIKQKIIKYFILCYTYSI